MAKLQYVLMVSAVAFVLIADSLAGAVYQAMAGPDGMSGGYNQQQGQQRYRRAAGNYEGAADGSSMGYNQQQGQQRYRRGAGNYEGAADGSSMGYNQQQGQRRYRRGAGNYQGAADGSSMGYNQQQARGAGNYQGAQDGLSAGYQQQGQQHGRDAGNYQGAQEGINNNGGQQRYRREVASGQWDQKLQGKGTEAFAPVTGSKSFKVNVADGIQGANQLRHETWDKGTMTGSYSQPIGDGKWQVVNYIADDKGFRIISTKEVDEAELLGGQGATKDKADVSVDTNGDKSTWSVTADQLKNKPAASNQVVKDKKDRQ